MPDNTTICAPWTPEQVDALNQFQSGGGMHPFTCGNDHHGTHMVLIARSDGWYCSQPPCDYRQSWAHAFMAQPDAWPKPLPRRPGDSYEQATGHETTAFTDAAETATYPGELRDRIAALFRHPPGVERLGDATPGEIADAVLAVVQPLLDRTLDAAAAINGMRAKAEARAEQAETVIARVRDLHQRNDQRRPLDLSLTPTTHCAHCGQDWPCDTVRTLEGQDPTP